MTTSWHRAPDGRQFRVFIGSCLCDPCWSARCECGEWLTKHDLDEEGAVEGALAVRPRHDPRPGFGHKLCQRPSRQLSLEPQVRTLSP